MQALLSRWSAPIYAIFRIVIGGLFLQHGLQKLFGLLPAFKDPHPQPAPWTQMWIGGVIELACGTLVLLGLGTRWAAFLASGTMAVAYFQVHQPQRSAQGNLGLPIQNGGELAVVYCFAFLLIASHGHGIWSISGRRRSAS